MTEVVNIGPAELNIVGVRAGDKNAITISFEDGVTPLNLVGATVTASARPTPEDDVTSIEAEVIVVDEVGGSVEVRWPGDDVRVALGASRTINWWWDLQILEPEETMPVTKVAGEIVFVMDITR